MAMRRFQSRAPLALAFFIALSGACGGDDDDAGVPSETETVPGPNVPQPPAQRSLTAEGAVEITQDTGEASSATLVTKVASGSVYAGKESGFTLRMECGQTIANVDVALYFPNGDELVIVERERDRWSVNSRTADVVPSKPQSADAGSVDAGDAGTADAGDVGDAAAAPPPTDPSFVNGVGLPGIDGRREVSVTLLASNGIRYDIRATIPWLASVAPATCQNTKPGTGTPGSSGGGCGGGSSSRRSSGGDWD
jgi:hypothetical protein